MVSPGSSKPIDEFAAANLLTALDLAVFEWQGDGTFTVGGPLPQWFHGIYPNEPAEGAINLIELFAFLEVFLPECEEVWTSDTLARAQSDIWTERDQSGRDLHLQAVAVRAGGRPILVLESPSGAYHERSIALQRAHDVALQSEKIERLSRELARLNDELKLRNQDVERATRAKSDFLARMSHEIRTPMNAIIGMADMLSTTPLTPEQEKYVEVFQRAGNNLLNLINDILDLSKVESGKVELEAVEFDLTEAIAKAVEIVAVRAAAKGLTIRQRIESDVPVFLVGDPDRLRQVLINLLGNSMKFTERGGLEVVVARDPEGGPAGALRFAVSDTGIGIPEQKLAAVFESFTQADTSTTRKYGGTGLGLSISKQLVELMNGRIWVQSELGVGSTFFFTARFGVGSGERHRYSPALVAGAFEPAHEAAMPSGLRILLADDSEDNRFLIVSYLKGTGSIVDVAENGEIAIAKFQSRKYDVVLMDVEMPVVDGYTATRNIRKLESDCSAAPAPILALTAHAFEESKNRSLDAGFTAHLTKPIRRAVLLEAIQQYAPKQAASRERIQVQIDPSLQDIVPGFLEKRRKEIPVLQDALRRENFDAIRVLGHNLKGCGAGYGFPALTEIGAEIERAAKERNAAGISTKLDELGCYLKNVDPRYTSY
jgi:signal transduction histidine kinase/CheY-like chemotaxis protein/HPt (histidine-containing phosphotransfer) domain-containing protein